MTELGHIGDGVYLSHDGFQFWLAANHQQNKVVALEPEVVFHLVRSIVRYKPAYIDGLENILNYEKEIADLTEDVIDDGDS